MHSYLTLLLLCGLMTAGTAAQEVPGQSAGQPADVARSRSVDETIRLAMAAIDRLSAAENPEAKQTIIDEIQRYTEQVQAQDPGNPWVYHIWGRVYASVGRLNDARDQLLKFHETREGQNEWRTHKILGDLFVDAFPRLAKPFYEKAAALKPGEPGALKGLSSCMYKLADYEKAIYYARRAADADRGNNTQYLAHLAHMLMADKRWIQARPEALVALEQAEAEARRRPGAAAPLEVLDKRYKLLIDIARGRIDEAPEVANTYVELARWMRKRAEVSAALAHHERLETLQSGMNNTGPGASPALLEAYAITLANVGRIEEAVTAFQRLLAIQPDNTTAREWLDRQRPPPADSPPPREP